MNSSINSLNFINQLISFHLNLHRNDKNLKSLIHKIHSNKNHLIFMYILLSYLASYETVCFSSNSSKGLKTVGTVLPFWSAVSRKSTISLIVVSLMTNICLARFYSRLSKHLFA